MRGNRKRDTRPELLLSSALHRRGLRYRRDYSITAGAVRVRPDFVYTAQRLAVFMDGCFWHSCPEHGTSPGTNSAYWSMKLERNRTRDRAVNEALREAGWRVMRIWEHEQADAAAERVIAVIRA
jgi:DNA mismatch endonuclease, patch repair protein